MIVLTGAAGFIGSCMAAHLLALGETELVLVDDFSPAAKLPNHQEKAVLARVERETLFDWLAEHGQGVRAIVHLGARTDTAEQDTALFDRLNVRYSQRLWQWCSRAEVPFLYASSAATYGGGEWGFQDDHAVIPRLKPLNPYGRSKQTFDEWVLQQPECPPAWAGWKFFNVYGPNEWHKGRMASVVYHAFHQIEANGKLNLFRSHRADIADGEQARDFVYVKDVVRILAQWLKQPGPSGIYNLGSGKARTFLDLAQALFQAMGQEPALTFIDTPIDIRAAYQYFTEADMSKLEEANGNKASYSLEAGVADYVSTFLRPGQFW
jgi:ADP-L-glycero-D-manno-heptose 6-epimerase